MDDVTVQAPLDEKKTQAYTDHSEVPADKKEVATNSKEVVV